MEEAKNDIHFAIANINPEPVGIFTLPLKEHLKYKELIQSVWENATEELFEQLEFEPYSKHLCNSSNQNLFQSFPILNELKHDLKRVIIAYIQKIGYVCEEIVINSAWLNNSQKDSTLNYHFHSNSYVSANYFVNFDPKVHSSLTFENDRVTKQRIPNGPIIDIQKSEKKTIYTARNIALDIKEGQIIVWRSHQAHGYYIPNKGSDRMTLSLNSMPKTLDNGSYRFDISE